MKLQYLMTPSIHKVKMIEQIILPKCLPERQIYPVDVPEAES